MQRVVRECSEFLGLRCNELREGCNRELLGVQRAAFPHYLYYLWPRPRSGATDSSMASFRFGTFMFKELIIGQEVLAGGAGGEQGAAVDGIPPGWGVGAQLFGDGIKMLFSSMTFCRIVLPTAAHGKGGAGAGRACCSRSSPRRISRPSSRLCPACWTIRASAHSRESGARVHPLPISCPVR